VAATYLDRRSGNARDSKTPRIAGRRPAQLSSSAPCRVRLGLREPPPNSSPASWYFQASRQVDRITRITVCTTALSGAGPRLDASRSAGKTIVHNYGHGGSGWSLSWDRARLRFQKAMATGERDIAVIGCGALGLTSAFCCSVQERR